jgi:BirA family transcriptional regulator, biotin operon repressor / biotin---[acetyl-CoA-carboxylase] ligase
LTAAPRFGLPRHHHRLTDSTNERARDLASAGAPDGTVVTAAEQTAGRGRHGRSWSAPAGKALLCSAILTPLDSRHRLLPLSVPLAVCKAAEGLGAGDCAVKWPNDVWLEERKLAGILIEAKPPQWAVIGIGLNLAIDDDEFPPELRGTATSIGSGASVDEALAALCEALDRWVEAEDSAVRNEFERRDALRGRAITWTGAGSGSGVAEGVDEDGRLVVATPNGEKVALGAGEVHLAVN